MNKAVTIDRILMLWTLTNAYKLKNRSQQITTDHYYYVLISRANEDENNMTTHHWLMFLIYTTISYSTRIFLLAFQSPIVCFFYQVKAIKVDHPADAHGFLIKDKKHSVVYSGDTKPCERLIQEGLMNCLLIFRMNTAKFFDCFFVQ